MQVLQAQGQSLVAPSDRSGLHPLLVPLTEQPGGAEQAATTVTCLLRWPEPKTHKASPLCRDGELYNRGQLACGFWQS